MLAWTICGAPMCARDQKPGCVQGAHSTITISDSVSTEVTGAMLSACDGMGGRSNSWSYVWKAGAFGHRSSSRKYTYTYSHLHNSVEG